MSFYTRMQQRQAANKRIQVLKEFDPDQPRDENGRWVAVSFGRSSFGVEHVSETGGKGLRSRGVGTERFKTMESARAHADALNRAVSQDMTSYSSLNLESPSSRQAMAAQASEKQGKWHGSKSGRSDEAPRSPLKGHAYHAKSDDELRYIAKDAAAAARSMRGMDDKAEGKYLDQVNDAGTVLYHRKKLLEKRK